MLVAFGKQNGFNVLYKKSANDEKNLSKTEFK